MGYAGQDTSVEIQLSSDGSQLAIIDLVGRRRPCEAALTADQRLDVAGALARMAYATRWSRYSSEPAKVPTGGGGRVDIAALRTEVGIYVFRPGAWASRSVRLAPDDARRLATDLQIGGVGAGITSSG